jgi:uncharacterized protein
MSLPGIVTNVTAFGAFVDIGVHQDGLVHISQLADRFVKDPADVVAVQQRVRVRVMAVDLERSRISLTMKPESESRAKKKSVPPRKSHSHKPDPDRKKRKKANKSSPFHNPFEEALGKK